MKKFFSHLDPQGHARMVDVSSKGATERFARASAFVRLQPSTLTALRSGRVPKGDVLTTAKIAGILAAKKTPDLIPLTHPLPLSHCEITFQYKPSGVSLTATVKTKAETGVEMEALTAVSVAALTVYDMIKSVEKGARIETIQLEEKTGGKSGHYKRNGTKNA
ncbi:MAG: cyclic pyranopterin monophosphate synthase MoaC [Elusimicrobia bacterium]|nr:cyclic pyranopterin monophosphate synthase MoaC [Elusimicrobiota bacterium]